MIKKLKPKDIKYNTVKALLKLTYKGGFMRKCFYDNLKHPKCSNNKIVYILYKHDKIIGWSLYDKCNSFECTANPCIMLYIKKEYRRKGYGSYLLKKTIKYIKTKKFAVWPHNNVSYKLFESVCDKKNICY